ncbi:hypothetical protein [Actinomadura geliboluensis]|uniref:Uncharacterized protein n=1 Tax=Actinomadura geliboluensis TaxID=882440 RepID=A0A5S4H8D7_9ACTN|nr:hypothetical protein [Actinomadura geliboluensis]TMR41518.1 hypothetical protein ETD96_05215 [Actinomadura geliboluensis]
MTATEHTEETMTEQQTEQIEQQTEQAPPAEGTQEASTPDVEPTGDALEGEQDGGKASREAAKYRTQLREAQARLEETGGRLAAFQRAEVVRLAGESLADGTDLFLHRGDDLSPYLSEDGTVDAEKVKTAVRELVQERSYLTGTRFQGRGGGGPQGSGGIHFGGKPVREPAPPRIGAIFDRPAS